MASWNEWVTGANMTLSEVLSSLNSARVGLDVKDKLYWSFYKIVELAIKEGNANFDVAKAAGAFKDLASRLNASDDKLNSATTQLALKVGGTVKLKPEDMIAEALALVTGTGTVNLLTIPQNDSVTAIKIKDEAVTVQKIEGSSLNKSSNMFDKSKSTIGYYISNDTGEIMPMPILAFSDYIRVKPNTQYTFFNEAGATGSFNAHRGAWYDENKVRIGNITGDDNPICVTDASPSNARYVRFNITLPKIDRYMWVEGTTYPSEYIPFKYEGEIDWLKVNASNLTEELKNSLSEKSRFANKAVNFLGTSLTNGVGVTNEEDKFRNIVASTLGFSIARNYAINGTLVTQQDDNSNSFVERYSSMDDNADLIIVECPTNDYFHGTGIFGEEDSQNPKEFYGALNILITGLKNKYPGKEILFVTTHNMHFNGKSSDTPNPASGKNLKDYRDAVINRCTYYGIDVLDLFSKSGIDCAHTVSDRATYTTDGVHLNVLGNIRYANKYIGYLKQF